MSAPTFALLAGEASGDGYGAALARALLARWPRACLVGTGGARMRAVGVDLAADLDQLGVMGLVEVLPRLAGLRRLERRLVRGFVRDRPDVVVPIDFPGFNMRVAARARALGIPVLYYVAPKVWASRPGRTAKLARCADRVAVVLPFEEAWLRARGVDATYVGHPLLDRTGDVADRTAFAAAWGLDPERRFLAVLPGSRRQEVRLHLEPFAEAARRATRDLPGVQAVLSRAPGIDARPFHDTGLALVDDSRALLRHADAALVKSGTSTLEAALEGTPHVIAYRMSPLTWQVAHRLLRAEHVGLPNLIAGARVVPEYLQDAIEPREIGDALRDLLTPGSPARAKQLEALAGVRADVGGPGASDRVVELIAGLLEGA